MSGSNNARNKAAARSALLKDLNEVLPEGEKLRKLPEGGLRNDVIKTLRELQDATEDHQKGTRKKIQAIIDRL